MDQTAVSLQAIAADPSSTLVGLVVIILGFAAILFTTFVLIVVAATVAEAHTRHIDPGAHLGEWPEPAKRGGLEARP
jgi:hypothetical protein